MWRTLCQAVTDASSNLLVALARAVEFVNQNCDSAGVIETHRAELAESFKGSAATFNQYWSELRRLSATNLKRVIGGKLDRVAIRKLLSPSKSHATKSSHSLKAQADSFFKRITTRAQAARVAAWLKQYAVTLK